MDANEEVSFKKSLYSDANIRHQTEISKVTWHISEADQKSMSRNPHFAQPTPTDWFSIRSALPSETRTPSWGVATAVTMSARKVTVSNAPTLVAN